MVFGMMTIGRFWSLAAVLGTGLAITHAPMNDALGQEFDNPLMGEAPCVVIGEFSTSRRGDRDDGYVYGAHTELRNLCGMAVEVELCLTAISEEPEQLCEESSLRPNGKAVLANSGSEMELVGPAIQWRYLKLQ